MADAVSEDLVIDFGEPGEIAPAGVGQSPLEGPAGYRLKLGAPTVRASRKNAKNIGISIPWTVMACGVGVSADQVDRTGEAWISLPEGSDRSESTKAGKGNRARIAEAKSLFIAAGFSPENVDKLLCNKPTVKRLNAGLAKLKDKEPVVYYGPPTGDEVYAEIKWISPDNGEAVLSGALKPKLKSGKKGGGVGAGNVDTFMDDDDDAASTGSASGGGSKKADDFDTDDWS